MFCLRFLADSAKVKLISSFQVFFEEKFHFTLWYSQMYFAFYAYNIFPVENVIASLRLPIMMRSSWWAYKNRENACPPGRELIDHTCTFTFWRNFFCEFQSLSFSPFSNRFKNSIFHQKNSNFQNYISVAVIEQFWQVYAWRHFIITRVKYQNISWLDKCRGFMINENSQFTVAACINFLVGIA